MASNAGASAGVAVRMVIVVVFMENLLLESNMCVTLCSAKRLSVYYYRTSVIDVNKEGRMNRLCLEETVYVICKWLLHTKETVTYLKFTFLLCIIYNKTNAKLLQIYEKQIVY